MPNPNLLVKGDAYGMIDHEEAFVHALGSDADQDFTPIPWREGGVVNDVGGDIEHPLWRGIKRHRHASFTTAVDNWKTLPDYLIKSYVNDDVFDTWSRHAANKITDYLLEAVENIDAVHLQIEANRCNS